MSEAGAYHNALTRFANSQWPEDWYSKRQLVRLARHLGINHRGSKSTLLFRCRIEASKRTRKAPEQSYAQ